VYKDEHIKVRRYDRSLTNQGENSANQTEDRFFQDKKDTTRAFNQPITLRKRKKN